MARCCFLFEKPKRMCYTEFVYKKGVMDMKDFSLISFKWTFRDYQQKVLDNADNHLKDRKIHIVAAPGSGKTVLGLELIRRLNAPALVLSPSVSIKQQWGERFVECYLPETEKADDYISFDLTEPKLLTSITYQALHAAVNRLQLDEENDEDALESEAAADFSNFDLLGTVKKAGICTLCLDEAHHLKSEWQRVLEKFIGLLGANVTVISLTATPPYDATSAEWDRYKRICGEIDEEIFVPQLVRQKTLCPHQDYIYFSYPTQSEAEMLRTYKQKAKECTQHILQEGYMTAALRNAGILGDKGIADEVLYDHVNGFCALITVAVAQGAKVPTNTLTRLFGKRPVPEVKPETTQAAFQFVIDTPEVFTEELSEELRSILAQNSLIEKRKVQLISNDKLDRMLASSMGKLKSIEAIAQHEVQSLGAALRMLVLTDFIKKEVKKSIGTDEELHTMGAVPVFEAIRRSIGTKPKVALLTGSLVILPNSAVETAKKYAEEAGSVCTVKPIEGTLHSEVNFSGSNKHKVGIITKVFAEGAIHILVGTKSLLGEGWDSPNINSLILASFVGSFMLSNQMRGRAIRVDKNKPGKVSNIWHLVTVLPESETQNPNEIEGNDFDTVKRRFACFQAPAYTKDVIESGIGRIDILTPPFNNQGIDRINAEMLRLSSDRKAAAAKWTATVSKQAAYQQGGEVSEVPLTVWPKEAVSNNKICAVACAVAAVLGIVLAVCLSGLGAVIGILLTVLSVYCCFKNAMYVLKNASPEKTVSGFADAVLQSLQDLKEIESSSKIKLQIQQNASGNAVSVGLTGSSEREKKVFLKAIRELFAAIDDPRYVIIGTTKAFGSDRRDYKNSYSCPTVFGVNKETAEILQKNLKGPVGNFELVFTRSENGRKILNECKKK